MAVDPKQLNNWVKQGVTPDMLYEKLRATPRYKILYKYKPVWVTESEWWTQRNAFLAVGRWYFGGMTGGLVKTYVSPIVSAATDKAGKAPKGWKRDKGGWYTEQQRTYFTDAQIGQFIARGITPTELEERYRWTQDAIANLANMNFLGKAIGKKYTQAQAYLVASGGYGSGQIRSDLLKAQNLREFDTVFAVYNNRQPTAADYAYLNKNFLTPAEYSAKMAAVEEAESLFPKIDALFRRVYGYGADKAKLRLMAQGAKGGGAYEALITAAEEMDRYRSAWKLYTKEEPTPAQYAEWAKMSGPDELLKMIEVKEFLSSHGVELTTQYNNYWVSQGLPGITADDLETLAGKYEGWGAIDAKMRIAEDHKTRQDQARKYNLSVGAAQGWVSMTPFGGTKVTSMQAIQG
jgi:hypothetical protein